MTNTSFVIRSVFVLTLLWMVSTSALGVVNTLTPNGQPLHWPNGGRNIPFNPDLGNLGPMTNAEAVAQTVAAFRQWADIPTATASYVNTGPLPLDVDETNFLPIVFGLPDGKGDGASDPGATDLSRTMNLSVRGTTYEQFDLLGPDQIPLV